MAQKPSFATPPPSVPDVDVSFPRPHVLLVTLNRPRQLNSIPSELHYALGRLYDWYDAEPSLRCAVLTGTGRAFCAGADLKEWNNPGDGWRPPAGFGGLSNRDGKKPVIAAVNGICFGGGMEMAINADLVYASTEARFGLPEVTIGVIAVAGALPRLIKSVGRQRASEMALIGRTDYTPEQMLAWGLVNQVVQPDSLMETALAAAEAVARNSPDAVIVSREGLKSGWEPMGPVEATAAVEQGIYRRMEAGENMTEGVKSFVEKRKPVYRDSKL
ncbi:enoyl-CoA hydratase/isomerase [Colletotrichum zoysiae]|uniref:Enoyl-CoA hydratase/isomerase n=1 Tax=Colletotrichum zoysiae TaxID=1216348 RepID=A0AAD9HE32_9PEZI|nr:enoyl-CoA hydratase/isomerase [Colletotrichum zoysiae]